MIKAIPIDEKGNPIGVAKNFSDSKWQRLKQVFGKKLAWKEVPCDHVPEPIKQPIGIKEVELIAPVSTKKAKRKNEK